jgi:hypothetical protein
MKRIDPSKAVVCWTVLLLAACGDDSRTNSEEDPAAHACEHAAESGTALTAAASAEEAPELALDEKPYTVALTPGAAGYVQLTTPAEALLFANRADVVTALLLDGRDASLPEPAPNEFCPGEIPEHFDLELEEAGNYVLRLGPSGIDSVWLMYSPAAGHAH